MKHLSYILIALFLSGAVFANKNPGEKNVKSETAIISGKILSVSGEEVVGAKILVKETSEVFYSDLNGNFSFEVRVADNNSIVIEGLGFSPAKVNASDLKQFAEIKLSEL